jgi:hypothetical protein
MENTLEMARRHVAQGRKVVARQQAFIEDLKCKGGDAATAERTLALFEQSLAIFEDHLKAIDSI